MKGILPVVCLICTLAYGCGACVFVTDEKACDSAYANAPRLPLVKIGMTLQEVRKTLANRDPDRREATVESETWYYMSDYERELMAKFIFVGGRLVEIEQVSWQPE